MEKESIPENSFAQRRHVRSSGDRSQKRVEPFAFVSRHGALSDKSRAACARLRIVRLMNWRRSRFFAAARARARPIPRKPSNSGLVGCYDREGAIAPGLSSGRRRTTRFSTSAILF